MREFKCRGLQCCLTGIYFKVFCLNPLGIIKRKGSTLVCLCETKIALHFLWDLLYSTFKGNAIKYVCKFQRHFQGKTQIKLQNKYLK